MKNVLVAYASRRGGTTGIAEWIAQTLTDAGIEVELEPASMVKPEAEFDAAIIAGSVYEQLWHPAARRLVHRAAHSWQGMPIWLVASGPLTQLDENHPAAIAPQLAKCAEEIHARGTMTFGGRLDAYPKGWIAQSVAKRNAGDFRDRAVVEKWAKQVAGELTA
ncbi:MAG TPA: flavodoxin domain-containing protein [Gryllotalpicola sp.]